MALFYHFTQANNLPSILAEGIRPGNFPLSEITPFQLVSLTSQKDSTGHGLFSGGVVHEGSAAFEKLSPLFPSLVSGLTPKRLMKLHDQTEVAIEVEVSSGDSNLWGLRHFANQVHLHSGKNTDLIIAASLATADFPHGDASHDILDARVRYYLPLVRAGLINNRGWHFYSGAIPARMIKRSLARQTDGSYA